mmetsp:Transcript_5343/g.21849  ORF Transcript_5343/g.21849 Transcript_5343/m.21849 type:complete len:227 (+) Transcript_5343:2137-2817(+)
MRRHRRDPREEPPRIRVLKPLDPNLQLPRARHRASTPLAPGHPGESHPRLDDDVRGPTPGDAGGARKRPAKDFALARIDPEATVPVPARSPQPILADVPPAHAQHAPQRGAHQLAPVLRREPVHQAQPPGLEQVQPPRLPGGERRAKREARRSRGARPRRRRRRRRRMPPRGRRSRRWTSWTGRRSPRRAAWGRPPGRGSTMCSPQPRTARPRASGSCRWRWRAAR